MYFVYKKWPKVVSRYIPSWEMAKCLFGQGPGRRGTGRLGTRICRVETSGWTSGGNMKILSLKLFWLCRLFVVALRYLLLPPAQA